MQISLSADILASAYADSSAGHLIISLCCSTGCCHKSSNWITFFAVDLHRELTACSRKHRYHLVVSSASFPALTEHRRKRV
ncbi:hypothetical protein DA391_21710 [Yersinia massiliensis]|uniref:Secreted protein n=1 Tax=Yersinia massiliensis TaxID=419257 RepID=A0ABM6UYJ9_9GAMM|nr:hypothetical protein DA391_21710 [Yersinia massiliensis]